MSLVPAFQISSRVYWARGGIWRVESITEGSHRLLCDPISMPLHTYDPMTEKPTAYLAFAQIRDGLWSPSADTSFKGLCDRLVEFVVRYGTPVIAPDSRPETPVINETVEEILQEAARLAAAVRCHQVLSSDWTLEPSVRCYLESPDAAPFRVTYQKSSAGQAGQKRGYDFDTVSGLVDWLGYNVNVHNHGLWGVYPNVRWHSEQGWQQGHIYQSLLCAMWLQLSQAMVNSSSVRRCIGCDILFQAGGRNDQVYHDHRCRAAANARNTYERKKRNAGRIKE